AAIESMMAVSSEIQSANKDSVATSESSAGKGRRRRGRRGGRNRRRDGVPGVANGSTEPASESPTHGRSHRQTTLAAEVDEGERSRHRAAPSVPIEPSLERPEPGLRGRFGDPGLSSRLTLLEMQFRRLLSCAPARLDNADKAPAGPGVFVLTDDEMTSY